MVSRDSTSTIIAKNVSIAAECNTDILQGTINKTNTKKQIVPNSSMVQNCNKEIEIDISAAKTQRD